MKPFLQIKNIPTNFLKKNLKLKMKLKKICKKSFLFIIIFIYAYISIKNMMICVPPIKPLKIDEDLVNHMFKTLEHLTKVNRENNLGIYSPTDDQLLMESLAKCSKEIQNLNSSDPSIIKSLTDIQNSISLIEKNPDMSGFDISVKPDMSGFDISAKPDMSVSAISAKPDMSVSDISAKPDMSVSAISAKPDMSVSDISAKPDMSVSAISAKPDMSVSATSIFDNTVNTKPSSPISTNADSNPSSIVVNLLIFAALTIILLTVQEILKRKREKKFLNENLGKENLVKDSLAKESLNSSINDSSIKDSSINNSSINTDDYWDQIGHLLS
jgi:hypothetical protein